jgi:hypothetical protein
MLKDKVERLIIPQISLDINFTKNQLILMSFNESKTQISMKTKKKKKKKTNKIRYTHIYRYMIRIY